MGIGGGEGCVEGGGGGAGGSFTRINNLLPSIRPTEPGRLTLPSTLTNPRSIGSSSDRWPHRIVKTPRSTGCQGNTGVGDDRAVGAIGLAEAGGIPGKSRLAGARGGVEGVGGGEVGVFKEG